MSTRSISIAARSLCLIVIFLRSAFASIYALTPVLSWTDAEAYANSLGGHLVAINSQAEQNLLVSMFGGTEYFWIGLTDQQVEGLFMWTNGDPVTYTHWDPGEPNNGGGSGEDYVLMNWIAPGKWNDGTNNNPPLRGIMEFAPEPPGSAIPAVASLALVSVRALLGSTRDH